MYVELASVGLLIGVDASFGLLGAPVIFWDTDNRTVVAFFVCFLFLGVKYVHH